MASTHKKTSQKRSKPNWFLACFGISSKSASEKKPRKSGGHRKSFFKLCLPKIKVIIIKKRKVSSDAKKSALKTSQSMIMLETTKVQQLKIKHVSNTQEPNVLVQPKGSNNPDLRCPHDQSDAGTSHKRNLTSCHTKSLFNSANKDSLFGALTMVIALIILSIWGRLCAILCMSAWLYCVPLVYKKNTTLVIYSSELCKKQRMQKGVSSIGS